MSKVYHFTKLNTAIEYILPSMTLRTNFLNQMNGPQERHNWSFGGVNIPYESLYNELFPDTHTDNAHFDRVYKLGEDIKSKIQAICFVNSDVYPGYENEMMWAQYSDNHTGLCLEIDTELFLQENKHLDIFKFQNVEYKQLKKQWIHWNDTFSKDQNIEQYINRNYESLFFSKSHYWEKEFEKRMLIYADDYCYLNIKESLTGVYYGMSSNHNYEAAIQQFINPSICKMYRVYFENNQLKRMERKVSQPNKTI